MRPIASIAALALVAACASSTPSVEPTTTASATTTTSVAPSTTTASATTSAAPTTTTAAPSTTAPASTTTAATTTTIAAATTTTEPCPTGGTLDPTVVAFPDRMSPLVGRDIRTGAHACFERVVIEFQAAADGRTTPFPGYAVRYVPLPVIDSPRGEPVPIDGTAALVVSFSAWMQTMEGDGYPGPWDVHPTNVSHIRELLRVENFEGMAAWAIGLDGTYPYVVTVLDGPPRLVIDIVVS